MERKIGPKEKMIRREMIALGPHAEDIVLAPAGDSIKVRLDPETAKKLKELETFYNGDKDAALKEAIIREHRRIIRTLP